MASRSSLSPASSTPARGMGRGLAAILSSSAGAAGLADRDPELRELPVDLIVPNPNQPRQHFDEFALAALARSVEERGLLQPVLVRPRPEGTYELIAGERRWRAARLAGLEKIPALVRPQDDAESLELALIENMVRENLNPIEEARACAVLVDELGVSREELGRRLGRSRAAVSNLMRILDLPDDALELIAGGILSEGHGRALLLAPDHHDRRQLARAAAEGGWSVRQTEERARATTMPRLAREAPDPAQAVDADQAEAARQLAETLTRRLDTQVTVTPRGQGFRIVMTVDSYDEAVAIAGELAPPHAA